MTEIVFGTAAEAPVTAKRPGRAPSPFEAPLLATLNNNEAPWATVTVSSADVDKIRQRIRQLAYKHNHGAQIRVIDHGDETSTLYFQATVKRPRRTNKNGPVTVRQFDAETADVSEDNDKTQTKSDK